MKILSFESDEDNAYLKKYKSLKERADKIGF